MKLKATAQMISLAMIVAVSGVTAAEKSKVKVQSGDAKIEATTDGKRDEANINGVKMVSEGGDASLSTRTVNLKVEANPDGSAKKVECNARQNNLRLTGEGSNLHIVGICKRLDVATTGAMVKVDAANMVIVSGAGNQVTVLKIDTGSITGSSNILQWREPLSVKKPKLSANSITSGIMKIAE